MKLLTKEIVKSFAKVGSQQDVLDPIIIAKFFDPTSSWTWYATEYNPQTKIFFGLVDGFEKEWGSFSLKELENITTKMGLGLERDKYFEERPVSEL
jgi:hypothetical protein